MHELQTTPAMDDTVLPWINGGVFGESVHGGDQNGAYHLPALYPRNRKWVPCDKTRVLMLIWLYH